MSACPWCRERLPQFSKAAACPACAKPLVDGSGAPLRPIDLDFEAILGAADERSLVWTKRGAVFAFVTAAVGLLLVLTVPPLAFVPLTVLLLGQFFWARFLVARPYVRHFTSPVRRFATRWLSRLALIFVVVPLHGSALVPGVGLVASPVVFGGACWTLRAYHRFHFLREHRREGVLAVEWVFLVLFAIAAVTAILLFSVLLACVVSLLPEGTPGK